MWHLTPQNVLHSQQCQHSSPQGTSCTYPLKYDMYCYPVNHHTDVQYFYCTSNVRQNSEDSYLPERSRYGRLPLDDVSGCHTIWWLDHHPQWCRWMPDWNPVGIITETVYTDWICTVGPPSNFAPESSLKILEFPNCLCSIRSREQGLTVQYGCKTVQSSLYSSIV